MTTLKLIIGEIFGLFVDDDRLAIGILALVAALAMVIKGGLSPLLAGPILLTGCALLLIENVWRSVRAAKLKKR